MAEVKTESHYGVPILLNQCKKCGGIWFDRSELYRTENNPEGLEYVDRKQLQNLTPAVAELDCPRDHRRLVPFHDQNFPSEIRVEYCDQCSGFWFNRDEFAEFQKIRENRFHVDEKRENDDSALAKKVDDFLASHSDAKKWESIGVFGKFLSAPVSHAQRWGGYQANTCKRLHVSDVIIMLLSLLGKI